MNLKIIRALKKAYFNFFQVKQFDPNNFNNISERMISTSFTTFFLKSDTYYCGISEFEILNNIKVNNFDKIINMDSKTKNVLFKNKKWLIDSYVCNNNEKVIFEFKIAKKITKTILSDLIRSLSLLINGEQSSSYIIYTEKLDWILKIKDEEELEKLINEKIKNVNFHILNYESSGVKELVQFFSKNENIDLNFIYKEIAKNVDVKENNDINIVKVVKENNVKENKEIVSKTLILNSYSDYLKSTFLGNEITDNQIENIRENLEKMKSENYSLFINNDFNHIKVDNKTPKHWNSLIRTHVLANIFYYKEKRTRKLNTNLINSIIEFVEKEVYNNEIFSNLDLKYFDIIKTNNYDEIQKRIIDCNDHISRLMSVNRKTKSRNNRSDDNSVQFKANNLAKNITLSFIDYLFKKIKKPSKTKKENDIHVNEKDIVNIKQIYKKDVEKIDIVAPKIIFVLYFYAKIFFLNERVFEGVDSNVRDYWIHIINTCNFEIKDGKEKIISTHKNMINFAHHFNEILNLDSNDNDFCNILNAFITS